MPEILTATQLRLLAMCERRVWLDKFGDENQRNSINIIALERGIQHEAIIHAATTNGLEEILVKTWEEAASVTMKLLYQRTKVVVGAVLQENIRLKNTEQEILFRGKIDRLQRHSKGYYFPIEIKQYNKLNDADYLQLDFYCFLLGKFQGVIPDGEFWLSIQENGLPAQKIPHQYNAKRFETAFKEWLRVSQETRIPELIYENHCRNCHWESFCGKELEDKLATELLWGLNKNSRQDIKVKGIASLREFANLSLDEISQIKGIKTTAPRFKAHAEAYVNQKPFIYAEFPINFQKGGVFFDLETYTTLKKTYVWCIGWSDINAQVKIVILNPNKLSEVYQMDRETEIITVQTTDALWELFNTSIAQLDSPIYHWSKSDISALKASAPKFIQDNLLNRTYDLADSFTKSVQLPIRSYTIKAVAKHFGYEWQHYTNYQDAYNDYKLWQTTGNYKYLERAASYQRDDVLALVKVWNWMREQQ